MNTLTRTISILMLAPALIAFQGCGADGAGDDHAEAPGHGADDGHGSDDGHNDQGGEEEHGGDVVVLTPAQLERAGVKIEPLAGGMIATHVTLPAEVGLNSDMLVHVTPRVPGVVSSVFGLLGQEVEAGTLLAVLESPELGEAKIVYLQAIQAKAIADANLTREQTISQNTALLLDLLRKEPTLDELRPQMINLRIGVNKGRLISTYARVNASRANYDRERGLRAKGLSTEIDLLSAQEAFNSSQAEYMAAFEDIDFTYRLRLQEAEQAAQVAASTVDNAERRLHIFGLSQDQVAGIADEPDTSVSRYELTAPSFGKIVSKHITPGEKVGTEEPVYTIANLQTVWLNISVYTRYADQIKEGLRVTIRAGGRETLGLVDYVSPVVSESTRTVSARVVIDNTDGAWKPGEFVTARVETGRVHADRIVPMDAIQTFEGQEVIFVQDEDGIEPVAVQIGRRNDTAVELLGDSIALGTPIVVKNSFLIKAELGKGSAEHGH
jgi:membrane fusion protein, heavy metal efflux system